MDERKKRNVPEVDVEDFRTGLIFLKRGRFQLHLQSRRSETFADEANLQDFRLCLGQGEGRKVETGF